MTGLYYNDFAEERRDDTSSSCSSGRDGAIENPGRRSIVSISKDMIRTAAQEEARRGGSPQSRFFQAMPPQVQRIASEGSARIAKSMQHSAILTDVGNRLSNLRRSSSSFSMNSNSSDRGIYASESMRSWGGTVSAEISTFATQKVVPIFRRSNTDPMPSSSDGSGNHSSVRNAKEVSFDYQLMKDNE